MGLLEDILGQYVRLEAHTRLTELVAKLARQITSTRDTVRNHRSRIATLEKELHDANAQIQGLAQMCRWLDAELKELKSRAPATSRESEPLQGPFGEPSQWEWAPIEGLSGRDRRRANCLRNKALCPSANINEARSAWRAYHKSVRGRRHAG